MVSSMSVASAKMTSGVAAQSARPTRAVRSRAAPFGLKGNAGSPRALRHSFVSTGAVSRNGFGLRKQQAVSAQRQDGRSLRVVNVSQIRDFNLNVEKEEGRLYYRLQYGKADWIKHRARNRYVRHLQVSLDASVRPYVRGKMPNSPFRPDCPPCRPCSSPKRYATLLHRCTWLLSRHALPFASTTSVSSSRRLFWLCSCTRPLFQSP